MTAATKDIRFAHDHPVGAGHFPGNPIIPGALLLDEVLRTIVGDDHMPSRYELRTVKFLAPVRPGDRIGLQWHEARGEIHFECVFPDSRQVAVTGTLRLSARSG